jgi:hypothetical protein
MVKAAENLNSVLQVFLFSFTDLLQETPCVCVVMQLLISFDAHHSSVTYSHEQGNVQTTNADM